MIEIVIVIELWTSIMKIIVFSNFDNYFLCMIWRNSGWNNENFTLCYKYRTLLLLIVSRLPGSICYDIWWYRPE